MFFIFYKRLADLAGGMPGEVEKQKEAEAKAKKPKVLQKFKNTNTYTTPTRCVGAL